MAQSRGKRGARESLGDEGMPRDDVAGERVERPAEEEVIRARAYELYLERGDGSGDETDDWLRAEREYQERKTTRSDGTDTPPQHAGP